VATPKAGGELGEGAELMLGTLGPRIRRASTSASRRACSLIWSPQRLGGDEGVLHGLFTPDLRVRDGTSNRAVGLGEEGEDARGAAVGGAEQGSFSGWEVTGWPVVAIRRGEVVYEGGKIVAAPGSGRLAPRVRWQRP
jgi:hypothetical protein